ncbi:hypothetical protein EDB84DRAFT_1135447 [Lactarius hengduanensis]|nr:hypothetical protein EDB84DRAFT_1135447 [Lactarius hengduanensis]
MAAGLATLTRLEFFSIKVSSYHSSPTGDVTLPDTRVVLPALVSFEFAGNNKYLEHFVAQIDASRLEFLGITYFCQIGFQIQLFQFIDRSTNFKRILADAQIPFDEEEAIFSVDDEGETPVAPLDICVLCECEEIDCQVSCMNLILSQSSTLFSHIQHLFISCPRPPPCFEDVPLRFPVIPDGWTNNYAGSTRRPAPIHLNRQNAGKMIIGQSWRSLSWAEHRCRRDQPLINFRTRVPRSRLTERFSGWTINRHCVLHVVTVKTEGSSPRVATTALASGGLR